MAVLERASLEMIHRIAQSRHHNVFKHSGSLDGISKKCYSLRTTYLSFESFFFNSFIDFDSCWQLPSCSIVWYEKERSIKLPSSFDHFSCIYNGGCFETALNLLNVSCFKMLTFRDFLHARKNKITQRLSSAQYGTNWKSFLILLVL